MEEIKHNAVILPNLFSKKGRICRTEFWFLCMLYSCFIALFFVTMTDLRGVQDNLLETGFIAFILVPCMGYLWGQAVKRCHDLGKSSSCLISPYTWLLLFYRKGEEGCNQYGEDPRAMRSQFTFPADEITDDVFPTVENKNASMN